MRLYDGCPDKELQALWDEKDAIKKRLLLMNVGCCWFPVEEKWGAYKVEDCKPIGHLCNSLPELEVMVRYTIEDLT